MSEHGPPNDSSHVAELIGASKVYKNGPVEIVALYPTDLVLKHGELLLIVGPSGSGKTTMLSLIGCVLYPTEGSVCIHGTNTKNLSDRQLARLRRENIGFIFQNYNLIGPLTSEDNVRVPLILNKLPKEEIKKKSRNALHTVGLDDRRRSIPRQLSGGEQQRVAIALIEGFRSGIANSGVFFTYSPVVKICFFLITLFISLGGAFFAMRRIAKVEPASVFKS